MENQEMSPGMLVTYDGKPHTVVKPDSDRMVLLVPGDAIPSYGLGRVAVWAWTSNVEPRTETV